MIIWRRLGAAAVLLGASGLASTMWPTTAGADAPVQTAWWNAVSGGGQAAPDPATPAGGLHVAVSSNQILAFGAVLYALPADATATLELKVSNLTASPVINPTAPTTDPAATIVACPITGAWKAGDDQPMDTAPAFSCKHSIPGNLSADQSTLTFLVDASLETTPGQIGLAILPVLTNEIPGVGTPAPIDTTQPFSLDLGKPAADSLLVTGTSPTAGSPPGGSGGVPPAATGSAGKPSSTSGGTSSSPVGGSGPVNLSMPSATTTAPTDSGSAPVVAGTQAPATAPAAAVKSSTSSTRRDAALALLILLVAAVLLTTNRVGRLPKHVTAELDPAVLAVLAGYGSRGLGRFSKPRTDAPRPLV